MNEMILVYFIASAILFLLGTLSGAYSALHSIYKKSVYEYTHENNALVKATKERIAHTEQVLKGGNGDKNV